MENAEKLITQRLSEQAKDAVEDAPKPGKPHTESGVRPLSERSLKTPDIIYLEGLVDKHNLASVLAALAGVVGDKADHIAMNWQDDRLAKQWEKGARVVDSASAKAATLGL